MNERIQNRILITLLFVIVVALISLVSATLNAKKVRKNFREEMAQRLDLEEKMTQMEKERSAVLSELKSLQTQLVKNKDEMEKLKNELVKEQEERTALKNALDQAKAEAKPTPAP